MRKFALNPIKIPKTYTKKEFIWQVKYAANSWSKAIDNCLSMLSLWILYLMKFVLVCIAFFLIFLMSGSSYSKTQHENKSSEYWKKLSCTSMYQKINILYATQYAYCFLLPHFTFWFCTFLVLWTAQKEQLMLLSRICCTTIRMKNNKNYFHYNL